MKGAPALPSARLATICRRPKIWGLIAIVLVLTAFYYIVALTAPAIYDSFPWVRLFIAFEFSHRLNGSLFYIPFLYAAVAFRSRGTLAIWLVCMAIIMPHVVDYSLDGSGLLTNVVVLSVPAFVILIVNTEAIWREKERKALEERELERQRYIAQIFEAQEAERKRISQELHDDTIQTMVVIANSIQSVVIDGESEVSHRARMQLERIQYLALHTTEELRRLCLDLRPSILDNLGLVPAVRWLLDRFDEDGSLSGQIVVTGEERKLSPDVEVLVFRFCQEALNNARQHADATQVIVSLEFGLETMKTTVQDNGRGFRVPPNIGGLASEGKLGLVGMQERARLVNGQFHIDSWPSRGTVVSLSIGA